MRSILRKTTVALACVMAASAALAEEVSLRPRDYGIEIGVLQPGANNAITDVAGVLVGQVNVHDDKKGAHTGVTAILPHGGNIFKEKVPAGIFLGNAFGKMAGYPQVKELGNIETPIVLTNTLTSPPAWTASSTTPSPLPTTRTSGASTASWAKPTTAASTISARAL